MTIGNILDTVAGYMQRSRSDFDSGSVNLLFVAADNARRNAEKIHDFVLQQQVATLSVDPTAGGNWRTAAVQDGTATPASIKAIDTVYWRDTDGNDFPIYHNPKKLEALYLKEKTFRRPYWTHFRYPSDADRYNQLPRLRAYLLGPKLFLQPAQEAATTVALDVNAWMDDYDDTDDAYQDWFTDIGADYLIYATLCEANLLTTKFAFRQEGNVPPPERARDVALAQLIEWDNFQHEQGRQPLAFR